MLGRPMSAETKLKISLAKIGKPSGPKGQKFPDRQGVAHHNWKSESVQYRALHSWVMRFLGKAELCVECGMSELPKGKKRYFQWANISHHYKRDLTDWKQLCIPCHKSFDGYGKTARLI